MELGCYEYDIMYRPGKNNIPTNILSRADCEAAINEEKLADIYIGLCHRNRDLLIN